MTSASSYRVFAILWVVSLIIWWQPITATLSLALRQDAYTHILLILPISIGLIVTWWNAREWKPSPSIRRGSVALGLAVLIGVAGLRWGSADLFTSDVRLSIEMLAVVIVVDWVVRKLLWRPYFSGMRLPAVFPAVVGTHTRVCIEPPRVLSATGHCILRASFVGNCGRASRSGRHDINGSWADVEDCPGVQQYSFQHDAGRQFHGVCLTCSCVRVGVEQL